ncbi:MAG: dihydropteroate synthase [Thermoplasmata archaeon]|nr:dihydropteroate synthase [Thermoplasmata archaeon]
MTPADARVAGSRRFRARVLTATTPGELAREIERTDSDPEGVGIMTRKGKIYPIRLEDVPLKAAPLLKQELLSVGGDAAHARGVADLSVEKSPVVLLATAGQYRRLIPKLKRQPFQLSRIAEAIDVALRGFTLHSARTIRGAHRSFVVGERTLVMGVVNVTPDSFSDGGRFLAPRDAIAQALRLESEGADLLDIGGESTRPGAKSVDPEEEWSRIAPVFEALDGKVRVPLSVDTRNSSVARRAVSAGADLINDVSGLRDPAMRKTAADTGAGVVIMHMRGTPETMQENTEYGDVRLEVFSALQDATALAVDDGITTDRILIDPGLGFGKSYEQNLELLGHLGELRSLGFPVLVGASRKSFLGKALGGAELGERLEAGIAAAVMAAIQGASVVRSHEVAATRRALALVDAVQQARPRSEVPEVAPPPPDPED